MIDWGRVRAELLAGRPVLIYDFDGREEEVDMVFYAGSVDYRSIAALRREAGGLICHAVGLEAASSLGLPFLSEILSKDPRVSGLSLKRPRYGDLPPYSLYINHVDVRTGISDRDRALTIRRFHEVVEMALRGDPEKARRIFHSEFMAPGHVPVLISRGLGARRGHTELSTAAAERAGLVPSMVIAEMLGEGDSLSLSEAEAFARGRGLLLLRGEEILGEVF